MSAKNFMSYGDAETVLTGFANAIKDIKDGTDIDSFGDVEVALLDKADTADIGTAAAKDSTNAVTAGSTDLVESGAVKDAIDAAVSAAYHHAGTKTVAQLTHDLLIAANEGNVYNITDSGTTTSDFIEGIGKTIDEGSNVGICKVGNAYMFDLLSGFVDTTNFVQKSQTAGLLKNDGTVNTTIEDDVNQVKSGLTNVGNITKLGYVQGTGEVSLSDNIDNYRYLFLTVGYYDSGFPSYGTAMFPTLMAPRGVGARVVCATDDDTNSKSVAFTLDDTHNKLSVLGTYDANRYLTLYGVV